MQSIKQDFPHLIAAFSFDACLTN